MKIETNYTSRLRKMKSIIKKTPLTMTLSILNDKGKYEKVAFMLNENDEKDLLKLPHIDENSLIEFIVTKIENSKKEYGAHEDVMSDNNSRLLKRTLKRMKEFGSYVQPIRELKDAAMNSTNLKSKFENTTISKQNGLDLEKIIALIKNDYANDLDIFISKENLHLRIKMSTYDQLPNEEKLYGILVELIENALDAHKRQGRIQMYIERTNNTINFRMVNKGSIDYKKLRQLAIMAAEKHELALFKNGTLSLVDTEAPETMTNKVRDVSENEIKNPDIFPDKKLLDITFLSTKTSEEKIRGEVRGGGGIGYKKAKNTIQHEGGNIDIENVRDEVHTKISFPVDTALQDKVSTQTDNAMLQKTQATNLNKNNFNKGGIDLTPANMNLQIKAGSSDQAMGGIKLHIDPAMLKSLQNAPGFTPVIVNIQPLKDLAVFLGINENTSPN